MAGVAKKRKGIQNLKGEEVKKWPEMARKHHHQDIDS